MLKETVMEKNGALPPQRESNLLACVASLLYMLLTTRVLAAMKQVGIAPIRTMMRACGTILATHPPKEISVHCPVLS